MIQLRDYQKSIVEKATEVIQRNGFVYLAMEVRTGKTLTSLSVATKLRAKRYCLSQRKKQYHLLLKTMNSLSHHFIYIP